MNKVYIFLTILIFIAQIWGIDLDNAQKLMETYRLAFNSGNPDNFDTILSDSFSYSNAEPELSKMIFKSLVNLSPYSISNFLNISMSFNGNDTVIVSMDMEISYGPVDDTIPQSFLIVDENNTLRIGAIISTDNDEIPTKQIPTDKSKILKSKIK